MKRLRGKLATRLHGRGGCFSFGNNAVTFRGRFSAAADRNLSITVHRWREPL